MQKRSVRINDEYWLIVSEQQPNRWTVEVWGPDSLVHDRIYGSCEDAQIAAVEVARQHFESCGVSIDIPERLNWAVAVAAP